MGISKNAVCWLVPDDEGGGILPVAENCCERARVAGLQATLLFLRNPTSLVAACSKFEVDSIRSEQPHDLAPRQTVDWLKRHPQRVLFLNDCSQVDVAIPYIPADVRCVYVVHDTAKRYFSTALHNESQLHAIVAVSETIAAAFRHHLRDPKKLHVIHNGTSYPHDLETVLNHPREDDVIFLGGDNPTKGAYDAKEIWRHLQKLRFKGKLHWFGGLSDAFSGELQRLPNASNLIVYGRVPRTEIFRAAISCKVFLMLSRVEPFGMATLDCIGMGCTPVAWDITTGTKEIVAPHEGRFVPLGAYGKMAASIVEACASHATDFAAVTARIRDDFSDVAMWASYQTLIDQLLATPSIERKFAGGIPPPYKSPIRLFQLLPAGARTAIRRSIGRSPRLGHVLRDFRGY